jgi:CheY-like chemotaxis protein
MTQKKILIVDDSPTIVMMEKTILARGAYDVSVATDGEKALDAVATDRPDLILMDIKMPRVDGLEAVKRLRANPDTQSIPIIMVTTKGEEGQREGCLAIGCNDFVTKPIDGSALLSKIAALIGS